MAWGDLTLKALREPQERCQKKSQALKGCDNYFAS